MIGQCLQCRPALILVTMLFLAALLLRVILLPPSGKIINSYLKASAPFSKISDIACIFFFDCLLKFIDL